MTWLDSVVKQVRDFDAARPRSQQAEVGWSEVGGCRAYLGFKVEGAWESDEPDTWAAQRGTAVHEYLQGILAAPGVRTEVPTSYRGIPGHADIVEPDAVTDIKSTRLANAQMWAADKSVLLQKRVQAHGYAAGLVDSGDLPEDATVRLLVVPVDGTFADWWAYEEAFDRSLADEGADRLEEVRSRLLAGERLPKDMPYQWCASYCEFFSLCRGGDDPGEAEQITDPELVAAIAAYGEANAVESAAKKDKERYAGLIRGLRGTAGGWRVGLSRQGDPKEVIDEEAVRADYEARGFEVPVTFRAGRAPALSVTRIKKAAAQ